MAPQLRRTSDGITSTKADRLRRLQSGSCDDSTIQADYDAKPKPTEQNDGDVGDLYRKTTFHERQCIERARAFLRRRQRLLLESVERQRRRQVKRSSDNPPDPLSSHALPPQPLLTAKNEWGVERFVTTFVRPELLPIPELHDAFNLAAFVARNILEVEPLIENEENEAAEKGNVTENAKRREGVGVLPLQQRTIVSPTQLIEWRYGAGTNEGLIAGADCLDASVMLASFLLGAGYDAYVVWGVAKKWVRECDQSRSDLRHLIPPSLDESKDEEYDDIDGEEKEWNEKELWGEDDFDLDDDVTEDDDLNERNDCGSDGDGDLEKEMEGAGLHAWILLKPGLRRKDWDYPSAVFVEATTGRFYATDDAPYLDVSSVWNDRNVWVPQYQSNEENGNEDGCREGIAKKKRMPDFDDLSSSRAAGGGWEAVLPVPERGAAALFPTAPNATPTNDNRAETDDKETPLDPPRTWVRRIYIPPESSHSSRCNRTVILCRRAKLELFANGEGISSSDDRIGRNNEANVIGPQGLVRRITRFADEDRTEAELIVELFGKSLRCDGLRKRVRWPTSMRHREWYAPGHPASLRGWLEDAGRMRRVSFYPKTRADGLVCREERFGNDSTIVERFAERGDGLVSRTIYGKRRRMVGGASGDTHSKTQEQLHQHRGGGVSLPEGDGFHFFVVTRIEEQYDRPERHISNERLSEEEAEDVAMRTFLLDGRKIVTEYHGLRGIARRVVTHDKDNPCNADGMKEAINAEKVALSSVKNLHQSTADLLRMRKRQETNASTLGLSPERRGDVDPVE